MIVAAFGETEMKMYLTILRSAMLAVLTLVTANAMAHGDVTPQAVDTSELPQLGDEWLTTNPYTGNELAIKIGDSAYNQNCARCHGLEVISGGAHKHWINELSTHALCQCSLIDSLGTNRIAGRLFRQLCKYRFAVDIGCRPGLLYLCCDPCKSSRFIGKKFSIIIQKSLARGITFRSCN